MKCEIKLVRRGDAFPHCKTIRPPAADTHSHTHTHSLARTHPHIVIVGYPFRPSLAPPLAFLPPLFHPSDVRV